MMQATPPRVARNLARPTPNRSKRARGASPSPAPLLLLALVGCAQSRSLPGSPLQQEPLVATQPQALDIPRLEALVHAEVNRVRLALGRQPLAWNPGLVAVARGHSLDMGQRRYFAHRSPEGQTPASRYRKGGYHCRVPLGGGEFLTSGENLYRSHRVAVLTLDATGQRRPHSYRTLNGVALQTVQGWLESPAHRKNMLKEAWRSEAIGVYVHTDGFIYITQNFC